MKFVISPEGQVTSVYSDKAIPAYSRLGEQSVQRASTVEFNGDTQNWEARHAVTGELLASGPMRNEVILGEIKKLEDRL